KNQRQHAATATGAKGGRALARPQPSNCVQPQTVPQQDKLAARLAALPAAHDEGHLAREAHVEHAANGTAPDSALRRKHSRTNIATVLQHCTTRNHCGAEGMFIWAQGLGGLFGMHANGMLRAKWRPRTRRSGASVVTATRR
ncbi:unnamed protein product, partial [Symbiodinium sp. CCMP2592]